MHAAAGRHADCIVRPSSGLDNRALAAARSHVMLGFGVLFGLVLLVGGLLFAFGLIGDQKLLIGGGLLVLALSAIFGLQPDWPTKRRPE